MINMADTGDSTWGRLAEKEHFGRVSRNYIVVPKSDLHLPKYCRSTRGGHCMIYSRSEERIFGIYSARAMILMQLRFDGYMGFPGGLINEGEDILSGLNRELFEEINLNVQKHPVEEEHYVVTHWCPSKKLLLHFYALEVSIDDLKVIEEETLKAYDYGNETLGILRIPLYTMGDGYRGFPAFLANSFAGNSRDQLLFSLQHLSIMSNEEITKAVGARPVLMSTEEKEEGTHV